MPTRIGIVANTVFCVLVAMAVSMVARPFTAELNRTVGTVWPFSTVHCLHGDEPGCEKMQHTAMLAQR